MAPLGHHTVVLSVGLFITEREFLTMLYDYIYWEMKNMQKVTHLKLIFVKRK